MQNCCEDCCLIIFGFLDIVTVTKLMLVNNFCYKVIKKNFLWNKLCLEKSFPTDIDSNQYINYKKCHIISKWRVGKCIFSETYFEVNL